MGLGIFAILLQFSQWSLVDLRDKSATWGMRTTPPPSSSGEFWAMCECTTQRIDVGDKGSFAVKPVRGGIKKECTSKKKPWPIHVPAAAARHEWWALFVLIGCTGCVGGKINYIQQYQ